MNRKGMTMTEQTEQTPEPQPGADADGFGGDAPEPAEPIQGDDSQPVDRESTNPENAPQEAQDGPRDPNAPVPVDQAGHPEAADLAGSYFGTVQTADGATPLADQDVTQPEHLAQTEETRKGYHGETPTSDADRESMTLAGRRQARLEREAEGTQEPGLDGSGDLKR